MSKGTPSPAPMPIWAPLSLDDPAATHVAAAVLGVEDESELELEEEVVLVSVSH